MSELEALQQQRDALMSKRADIDRELIRINRRVDEIVCAEEFDLHIGDVLAYTPEFCEYYLAHNRLFADDLDAGHGAIRTMSEDGQRYIISIEVVPSVFVGVPPEMAQAMRRAYLESAGET